MNIRLSLALLGLCLAATGKASAQIYRCGDEYTNIVPDARKSACKLIDGAKLSVVPGFVGPATAATRSASAAAPMPRVDAAGQRARDADARQILEAELKKAEARQLELLRDYNNGEPDRRSDEARNYQKYLDRVAELKASLVRNEADIAGLRREISRLNPSK